jgi:hypothetical protein
VRKNPPRSLKHPPHCILSHEEMRANLFSHYAKVFPPSLMSEYDAEVAEEKMVKTTLSPEHLAKMRAGRWAKDLPSFGSKFVDGCLPQGHPAVGPAMPGGLPSCGWGSGRT